jgi:hypothetical protein
MSSTYSYDWPIGRIFFEFDQARGKGVGRLALVGLRQRLGYLYEERRLMEQRAVVSGFVRGRYPYRLGGFGRATQCIGHESRRRGRQAAGFTSRIRRGSQVSHRMYC